MKIDKEFKKRKVLIALQVAVVYIINTVIIALFFFEPNVLYQQIVMALNLVATFIITLLLWRYLLRKKHYGLKPFYAMFIVVLIASLFKYIANAFDGDISIVYALLILFGFIELFREN